MAELEVGKSLKKVREIAKSPEHSLKHKIKEIIGEILIIVFAVSLSIYFHSWSEERHEQHEVKVFMSGLKRDLQKDIDEMKGDIKAFENQKKLFQYIAKIPNGQFADQDSINLYKRYFFSYTGIGKNNGRYEGFKSSGKIQFIENPELQNTILDLYEEQIPLLRISTDYYKNQKTKVADYILDNTQGFPDGNFLTVISSPQVKSRCAIYLSSVDQIINQYKTGISTSEDIISKIDEEYVH